MCLPGGGSRSWGKPQIRSSFLRLDRLGSAVPRLPCTAVRRRLLRESQAAVLARTGWRSHSCCLDPQSTLQRGGRRDEAPAGCSLSGCEQPCAVTHHVDSAPVSLASVGPREPHGVCDPDSHPAAELRAASVLLRAAVRPSFPAHRWSACCCGTLPSPTPLPCAYPARSVIARSRHRADGPDMR